jgi:hypothetical protein
VLRDWNTSTPDGKSADSPRVMTWRARQRTLDNLGQQSDRSAQFPERGLIRRHPRLEAPDNELRLLEEEVASAPGKQQAMELLGGLMSPEVHHTAVGLMATRMYTQLFDA